MTSVFRPQQKLTFEQFLEQSLEDGRHELIHGEIVPILAARQHEDVADFIQERFNEQIKHLQLNYKVSNRIVLATTQPDGSEQGRNPGVSVVNLAQ